MTALHKRKGSDSSTESNTPTITRIDDPVCLKRQITLWQAVSICVGYMIGSGIFVSPYGVLKEVRSVGMALIIWACCGIFNMIGALCYAELGAMMPRSGGEYTYILKGFGRFPAFLALWMTFVLNLSVMTAASSLIFSNYILQPFYPDCEIPQIVIKLVAVSTLLILMLVNCFNVRWAAKVQVIFAISAVIALLVIISIGMYAIFTGQAHNFEHAFEGSNYSPDAMAIAFYSAFWSYSGWNSLNSIAGEIKDPVRNLPRAVIISISIVTVIYLLANVAYMAVLSVPDILSSTAIAMTFADATLGPVAWVMPLFVACSIIGTINGGLLAVSRVFSTGAQDGNFPSFLAMINYKRLTPAPSIIATTLLSVVMVQANDIFFLIEVVGFGLACILGTTYASMIYMRIKHPECHRPIKMPLFMPILLMCIYVLLISLSVYRKPYESLICICVICVGGPAYLFGVAWRPKPHWLNKILDNFTIALQKALMVVPQDLSVIDDIKPKSSLEDGYSLSSEEF